MVNPETKADVPDGEQGLLLARGPGVTGGYFDDEASTAAAFAAGEGWFDTGDLGWRCPEVRRPAAAAAERMPSPALRSWHTEKPGVMRSQRPTSSVASRHVVPAPSPFTAARLPDPPGVTTSFPYHIY